MPVRRPTRRKRRIRGIIVAEVTVARRTSMHGEKEDEQIVPPLQQQQQQQQHLRRHRRPNHGQLRRRQSTPIDPSPWSSRPTAATHPMSVPAAAREATAPWTSPPILPALLLLVNPMPTIIWTWWIRRATTPTTTRATPWGAPSYRTSAVSRPSRAPRRGTASTEPSA